MDLEYSQRQLYLHLHTSSRLPVERISSDIDYTLIISERWGQNSDKFPDESASPMIPPYGFLNYLWQYERLLPHRHVQKRCFNIPGRENRRTPDSPHHHFHPFPTS